MSRSRVIAVAAIVALLVAATIPPHYIVRWASLFLLSGWLVVSAVTALPPGRGRVQVEPPTPKNRLRVLSSVVKSALEGSEHSREILIREVLELAREAGVPREDVRDMESLLRSERFDEALEECLDRIERVTRVGG